MPGYVTIKTGFNVIFSNLLFKRVVQNAVNAVPPILIATHLFATFHVTRLLEAGQSLGTLDQTFYNRCTAAVTTAIDGSEPLDLQGLADPRHAKHDSKAGQQFSDLNTSLVDFNAALPAGHRGPIVWHACPHHCTRPTNADINGTTEYGCATTQNVSARCGTKTSMHLSTSCSCCWSGSEGRPNQSPFEGIATWILQDRLTFTISLFMSRPRMKLSILVRRWVFTLNCLLQTVHSDVFRSVPH